MEVWSGEGNAGQMWEAAVEHGCDERPWLRLAELRERRYTDRSTATGLAAGALLSWEGLPEEETEALNTEYGPWLTIDMLSGPLELGEVSGVPSLTPSARHVG